MESSVTSQNGSNVYTADIHQIYKDDIGVASELYEINIFNTILHVAPGKTITNENGSYLYVYAIKNEKVVANLGVYELLTDDPKEMYDITTLENLLLFDIYYSSPSKIKELEIVEKHDIFDYIKKHLLPAKDTKDPKKEAKKRVIIFNDLLRVIKEQDLPYLKILKIFSTNIKTDSLNEDDIDKLKEKVIDDDTFKITLSMLERFLNIRFMMTDKGVKVSDYSSKFPDKIDGVDIEPTKYIVVSLNDRSFVSSSSTPLESNESNDSESKTESETNDSESGSDTNTSESESEESPEPVKVTKKESIVKPYVSVKASEPKVSVSESKSKSSVKASESKASVSESSVKPSVKSSAYVKASVSESSVKPSVKSSASVKASVSESSVKPSVKVIKPEIKEDSNEEEFDSSVEPKKESKLAFNRKKVVLKPKLSAIKEAQSSQASSQTSVHSLSQSNDEKPAKTSKESKSKKEKVLEVPEVSDLKVTKKKTPAEVPKVPKVSVSVASEKGEKSKSSTGSKESSSSSSKAKINFKAP